MAYRRTRFEIAEDENLLARIKNLEKLIAAPDTTPEQKEKYFRQLSATRGRLTRLRHQREDKRRRRRIEAAQKQIKRLANEPAPELSADRRAELPPGVREIFEENATTSSEPQDDTAPPQSVPDPIEEAAEAERAEVAEQNKRLHKLEERVWQSYRGFFMVYRLRDGRLVNNLGWQIDPQIRRAPNGQWFNLGGSPVVLLDADDVPTPGKKFFHGFCWSPEQYADILEKLGANWELPPLMLTPEEARPVIASKPGERREMIASILKSRRQAERKRAQDPSRWSLGPVSGVGRLGSAGC